MRQLLSTLLAFIAGCCAGLAVGAAILAMAGLPLPLPEEGSLLAERFIAAMAVPGSMAYPALLAAHAAGAFAGAAVAARLAPGHGLISALAIGFTFLSAGIASVLVLDAPFWFQVLDLNLAFGPMAWLGWRVASAPVRRAAFRPRAWHPRSRSA
ncbi:hypothetical protein [Massilia sp. METH4]|uniref:hypothetical protein n=1 Tax=Massilia sp. METH4 TaxID=3123041 RepID=UPI0030D5CCF4